ncbi:hypothetical protein E4U17_006417 [Claviceps sp. LM77 group G4]|nr:hypothetical protein E4U17_006417 [Claviceps sp. LM77 group G4]
MCRGRNRRGHDAALPALSNFNHLKTVGTDSVYDLISKVSLEHWYRRLFVRTSRSREVGKSRGQRGPFVLSSLAVAEKSETSSELRSSLPEKLPE